MLRVQAAVVATPAVELVLYPQLFLAALSSLDLPFVSLHAAALSLFSKVRSSACLARCDVQLVRQGTTFSLFSKVQPSGPLLSLLDVASYCCNSFYHESRRGRI